MSGGIHDTLVGMAPVVLDEPIDGVASREPAKMTPVRRPRKENEAPFLPQAPDSVRGTGLSRSYMEELVLKHFFQAGDLRGSDVARRTCLPNSIVEELLTHLRKQKFLDLKGSGGIGLGHSSMIFSMTEAGFSYCEHTMERDQYVGPAPVPFRYYLQAVAAQSIRGGSLQRADIEDHFGDLVLKDDVFDSIGPAMNSGKALFFYGPPGNGKTAICERMTHCFGGDVFVPHAIIIDDFVIKLFDETIHKKAKAERPRGLDHRWVLCERPMVVVGGELQLEDLNLTYSPQVKYYEAPVQMKANCGMLLVDDFGRQTVSPKALLNRWIVPLESEVDYLTMHTGKKLRIPFDVFVVFSTNLDPKELVDDAFLRRVRYKLEVSRPDRGLFEKIFEAECGKRDVPWDPDLVNYLIEQHYTPTNRPFNACEPRDLLAQVRDLCAYQGVASQMSKDVLDRVAHNYFVKFD